MNIWRARPSAGPSSCCLSHPLVKLVAWRLSEIAIDVIAIKVIARDEIEEIARDETGRGVGQWQMMKS